MFPEEGGEEGRTEGGPAGRQEEGASVKQRDKPRPARSPLLDEVRPGSEGRGPARGGAGRGLGSAVSPLSSPLAAGRQRAKRLA